MAKQNPKSSRKSPVVPAVKGNAERPAGVGKPPVTMWYEGQERRAHRRHDLELRGITVERLNGAKAEPMGRLVDLSAGGLRLRTGRADVAIDTQIRVRIELPSFAGISPFIDRSGGTLRPKREWTGWVTVRRVRQHGPEFEVGATLADIDELDRGMLSLYLSTQPLAA